MVKIMCVHKAFPKFRIIFLDYQRERITVSKGVDTSE